TGRVAVRSAVRGVVPGLNDPHGGRGTGRPGPGRPQPRPAEPCRSDQIAPRDGSWLHTGRDLVAIRALCAPRGRAAASRVTEWSYSSRFAPHVLASRGLGRDLAPAGGSCEA